MKTWRTIQVITALVYGVVGLLFNADSPAAVYTIRPAVVDQQEEFEILANRLQAGDELILEAGTYSQTGRRAVTARGTADRPIRIRAAAGATVLLTRPADNLDTHNNVEFVDCAYLVVRGLTFRGGSSGVRFIRGHHVTLEDCTISHTGNNALTMNSGDCDHFIVRRNHIHHTGLSARGPTEGEGMYIGCHDGSCVTTDSLFEGNYIHHTRGTSDGGNDGIEIKYGSCNNTVRNNVIHDTNIGRRYPGIFVYGSGGRGVNRVESNVIWNAGEGIQVVSDAVVCNNIIFHCSVSGITAAGHAAVEVLQNTTIVHNTIMDHPCGLRIRWERASNMVFANNAVYCPNDVALDAAGLAAAAGGANYVRGRLVGVSLDGAALLDGGHPSDAFVGPSANDFWPKAGSVLLGGADPRYAAGRDFNGLTRRAPFDAGAYQANGRPVNPGWRIRPGLKIPPADMGNESDRPAEGQTP
ncbi:MAG: right-handed parallel beta-helix repeat-containing protein [Sedimentisphaerales bacterium]|nr:right-handed parallel beta-helix repeat-containing protein [Sedimentisphaerales bacterium]